VNLRRLGPGDEAAAGRVLEIFKSADAPVPARFLADPHTLLIVAEEESGPVGWAYGYELLRPEGWSSLFLYEIEVLPAARRRRVGSALITEMLAEARRRGCMEMWLVTERGNEEATALYESAGARRDDHDSLMFTWGC
jgi:ribosomal protein S18 acetylase RimI-like enzyme